MIHPLHRVEADEMCETTSGQWQYEFASKRLLGMTCAQFAKRMQQGIFIEQESKTLWLRICCNLESCSSKTMDRTHPNWVTQHRSLFKTALFSIQPPGCLKETLCESKSQSIWQCSWTNAPLCPFAVLLWCCRAFDRMLLYPLFHFSHSKVSTYLLHQWNPQCTKSLQGKHFFPGDDILTNIRSCRLELFFWWNTTESFIA